MQFSVKSQPFRKFSLFQPTPLARRLFWHVLSTGADVIPTATELPPFKKPGVQLLWVEAGCGQLQLPSGRYDLSAGRRFWLFSTQQPRSIGPSTGKPFIVNGIRFGGPNLEAWMEELDAIRRPVFQSDISGGVRRQQRQLWELARKKETGWEWKIHLSLTGLLGELARSRNLIDRSHQKFPLPLTKLFNAVAAHPDRAWNVPELAVITGVSYSRLRGLFREAMQQSIHDFLQERRLDRARFLLGQGNLGIKEVAEKLGFSSEFYFSNFFKSKTGLRPVLFRKHHGVREKTL